MGESVLSVRMVISLDSEVRIEDGVPRLGPFETWAPPAETPEPLEDPPKRSTRRRPRAAVDEPDSFSFSPPADAELAAFLPLPNEKLAPFLVELPAMNWNPEEPEAD